MTILVWNVNMVVDMNGMLYSTFNQPIGKWNVGMNSMPSGASMFSQPIAEWNVCEVTNMECMFNHARSFTQPVDQWRGVSPQ
ncbi:BspA family leucine-rich repeat surface protein [archaeon]|nr:MAG: BspA family leucine-rich repeat surface protein [archaeon]